VIIRIVAVAACVFAVAGCSTSPAPVPGVPSSPSAVPAPVAAACAAPEVTWTGVEKADGLAAVSKRVDAKAGQQIPLLLEPALTGATVGVDAAGIDPEVVYTALEKKLNTGGLDVTVARPDTPLVDPATRFTVPADVDGGYVGYRVVSLINATFTYLCANTDGIAQSGTVSTWSDVVSGALVCGRPSDSGRAVLEQQAAKVAC
jgi:hypothetical protein